MVRSVTRRLGANDAPPFVDCAMYVSPMLPPGYGWRLSIQMTSTRPPGPTDTHGLDWVTVPGSSLTRTAADHVAPWSVELWIEMSVSVLFVMARW